MTPWPYSAYEGPYGPGQVSHRAGVDATGQYVTACEKTFDPDREDWGVSGPNYSFVPVCPNCQRVMFAPLGSMREDVTGIAWRADGDRVVTYAADGFREALVCDAPTDALASHIAQAHNDWLEG